MAEDPEIRTPEGEAATDVILSVFRANGLLIAAGDELTAEHGLTSARWQVLAALHQQNRPLTVPQIARRRGITRQSVHASVNHLLADGLVELVPNDDHRRSQLVCLTDVGRPGCRRSIRSSSSGSTSSLPASAARDSRPPRGCCPNYAGGLRQCAISPTVPKTNSREP